MILLKDVYLKYTKEFYALTNINLHVSSGEIVALVGEKGSGKTCILRLLAGNHEQNIYKGEVYIKNIPLSKVDYRFDVSMGYLPYVPIFDEKKSVYDSLKYVLDIRDVDKSKEEKLINEAIIDFHLEKIANEKIKNLSKFEKYLVSIARLSFRELEIVLIDNIFEENTPEQNKELIRLFKKYFFKQNSAVVLATSSEELAKQLSTRRVYLKYGVIEKVEE